MPCYVLLCELIDNTYILAISFLNSISCTFLFNLFEFTVFKVSLLHFTQGPPWRGSVRVHLELIGLRRGQITVLILGSCHRNIVPVFLDLTRNATTGEKSTIIC